MADPERPFPLATVIWFESLEFMSLGYGYDMVLLLPRHPTGHDHELSQPGGALHQYHRCCQARTARRCRAQHSYYHRLAEGDGVPHSGAPQPDADTESLGGDLCRMSLAAGKMPMGHPVIPPSGTAPPPAESGSVSMGTGTMPPWTSPYGLNMAAQEYASSVSTSIGVYEELPRHHLRSALGTKPRAIASHHTTP
jgi:hypothetical protein